MGVRVTVRTLNCTIDREGLHVVMTAMFGSPPPPLHQELLKAIVLRTRRSLDEDIFLPLYPKKYAVL